MTKLINRFRDRRAAYRRERAIEKALASCSSQTMRDELLTIASRY